MATRSTISYVEKDGKGKTIYCHWDGYPSNNGKLLKEHYNTLAKVRKLVALGDLSVLGDKIGKQIDFDTYDSNKTSQCLAYGRDRGETDIEPRSFKGTPNEEQEYDYLYKGGKWYVRSEHNGAFNLLTDEMVNKE